jgi:hypothetical protein
MGRLEIKDATKRCHLDKKYWSFPNANEILRRTGNEMEPDGD